MFIVPTVPATVTEFSHQLPISGHLLGFSRKAASQWPKTLVPLLTRSNVSQSVRQDIKPRSSKLKRKK